MFAPAAWTREARRKLEESLQARMESLNMELDPFERVSMIVIVDGPWSTGNGLMTPTLKIRRGALESRYEQMIEEWRRMEAPVVWETLPGFAAAPYVAATTTEVPVRQRDVPPSQT